MTTMQALQFADYRLFSLVWRFILALIFVLPAVTASQDITGTAETGSEESTSPVAEQINVNPNVGDQAIDTRLTNILKATGWFSEIDVQVEEGLVFLDGQTNSPDYRKWAGELAGRTLDVVAVVNRIKVAGQSPWDVAPAIGELQNIRQGFIEKLPRLGVGLLFLVLVWLLVRLLAVGIRSLLSRRLKPLLRDVATRIISILFFLIGVYLALQVAGLSGLAATVLGGTGIAGLVAGIAFRDILENYLASVLISIRNPFKTGDLVKINEHTGIVERVTTRGTVLMNLDGNHVQIPNAIVYKSIILNYTANPNRRDSFDVGIGYENEASRAQEVALEAVNGHPAVLSKPEALVLVDRLGSATVNLKIYFWYDGTIHSVFKVKSALIRLVKRAFEKENISMPDEAREILFPAGVPVKILESHPDKPQHHEKPRDDTPDAAGQESLSTEAEGSMTNEDEQLQTQARESRSPETGPSLLEE